MSLINIANMTHKENFLIVPHSLSTNFEQQKCTPKTLKLFKIIIQLNTGQNHGDYNIVDNRSNNHCGLLRPSFEKYCCV